MSEWRTQPLGKIARIEIGRTPSRNEPSYWATEQDDGYPWVAISDIGPRYITTTAERITKRGVESSNTKLVPPGTVIMSFKLTIGRTSIAGIDLFTNEAIASFFLERDEVDPAFLFYMLPIVASSAITDTAIKGATLNKDKLRNLPFRFPLRSQQRKIAHILTTVDNLIEKTEALIAKYQAVKQGMMHDLFSRGVDEKWHLRPTYEEAPDLYKPSELGWIPKEWEITPLSALTPSPNSITYGVLKPGPYVPDGVPLLQIQDVIHGEIDVAGLHRISPELDQQYSRTRLQGGDLVMSLVGTIGRVAQIPRFLSSANLHRNLGLIRVVEPYYPRYLLHFLKTLLVRRSIEMVTFGSTQSLLNLASLRALPVSVPRRCEQVQIATALDAQDSAIRSEQAHLGKLRTTKIALMQDLLTGKVRVKVDESEGQ